MRVTVGTKLSAAKKVKARHFYRRLGNFAEQGSSALLSGAEKERGKVMVVI